jgi:hypothetical protein
VSTVDFLYDRHDYPNLQSIQLKSGAYIYYDRRAATTAKAPMSNKINTPTYNGFIPLITINKEPPRTMKTMPQPKVVKAPPSSDSLVEWSMDCCGGGY